MKEEIETRLKYALANYTEKDLEIAVNSMIDLFTSQLQEIKKWIKSEVPTFKTDTAGGKRDIILKDDLIDFINLLSSK